MDRIWGKTEGVDRINRMDRIYGVTEGADRIDGINRTDELILTG